MKKTAGREQSIIVVGAGAAGMMAACAAAEHGAKVLVLEKNEKAGKKIYITGKGRCNFTNLCDTEDFFLNVPRSASFLYSSVYGFDAHAVRDWFEEHGVRTKEERGQRAFPLSDHASDITRCLVREMERLGVEVWLNTEVKEVLFSSRLPEGVAEDLSAGAGRTGAEDMPVRSGRMGAEDMSVRSGRTGAEDMPVRSERAGAEYMPVRSRKNAKEDMPVSSGKKAVEGVLLADGRKLFSRCVIVATGGLSYPSTGSTGDGYRFARSAGHEVSRQSPSLVPFEVREEDVTGMQGLSLKNVTFTVAGKKKNLFHEMGELMFTHFGVTGPLILKASALVQDEIAQGALQAWIDLKPALTEHKLDARILRDFEEGRNRSVQNAVRGLYPSKLIPVILKRAGIDPDMPVHDVTAAGRRRLVQVTKRFELTLTGLRGFSEAVITRGGVNVRQVDPGTMESKLVKGLYFAGEVLDVDAFTGGFNLQIAWSTGRAAGEAGGTEYGI